MPNNLPIKLKIKEGYKIYTVHAPNDFRNSLKPLPAGACIVEHAKDINQVHWFVSNQSQLKNELTKLLKLVKNDVVLWIYYPKASSKIQTDLTRDKGWNLLLSHKELHWISLISFDDTWSAFGCRLKTEKDLKRESRPKEKPVLQYIDAKNKSVRLPNDFEKELKKNKKREAFFNSLSFTNRKEYVEWIVSAKRPETRRDRISGSMVRLGKGWKNPSNR